MLLCIFCTCQGTIPTVFQSRLKIIGHTYAARDCNCNEKCFKFNQIKFSILSQGPHFWNKLLRSEEKNIPFECFFLKKKNLRKNFPFAK